MQYQDEEKKKEKKKDTKATVVYIDLYGHCNLASIITNFL